MSSHREAPEIAKDPVADNTDVYAFVSPDKPDTVTILANYIPLQGPAAGPNFFSFGDDVLYEIHIDNNGDGLPDLTYQFRFQTQTRNPNTFLYNTGPITALDSKNWNRPQFYSVTLVNKGHTTKLGDNLTTPPCNIGPRSTPNYAKLAGSAVHSLSRGEKVFAGQRAEGFFVDLGSVFDLLDLRPFQNLHLIPSAAANGVNGTKGLSVHTIALQIPKKLLTRDGSAATNANDARSVIGVWASASRQKARVRNGTRGQETATGPWVQVSRLGNPLFNEVVVPLGDKDYWNSVPPAEDKTFAKYVLNPELARLIPVLYPKVFPHLAALKAPRADLAAILLTGIPSGLISGFQNFTGKTQADMLRLNMAIPPTNKPNNLGLLGNDLAGFPNGRRLIDDVVTIELRAVAGATYPLIDHKFEPDAAVSKVTDGVTAANNAVPFLNQFPYLGTPVSGFDS
ncbi:hypothetical protein KSF_034710 [Reticulibacter mediterranei]|uniref:DUF4331 domain-containing protein n=1 Tax=Reticulibacter mediterranei TaxID=2778369 RepID=A0A8J3IGZ0_9CHLR|nr:DUF4331 domain-containing protein [Reticulibacter mediterranei]GHO93423.1 hypothetical protein KSF_034710 [Reticulibacter mediterranei]